MKTTKIATSLVFLFLLAQSVSAYYTGGSYYSRLPYYEQTNFFSNADISKQTLDSKDAFASYNQDVLSRYTNTRNKNQQLGALGYYNSILSNSKENSGLNLYDGYNIVKEPKAYRKIKVNNPGKKNDFTITETIYDGVSGNFYKDNRATNSLSRDYSVDQRSLGLQAYNIDNLNEGNSNRNAINVQGASSARTSSLKTLKANIGKGDLIILN